MGLAGNNLVGANEGEGRECLLLPHSEKKYPLGRSNRNTKNLHTNMINIK